jgi:peptidoglycan/LPS O-acetylase OafA/YrhL
MRRIPELDGLRGIAVLVIVLHHYVYGWIESPEPDSLLSYSVIALRWGHLAVDLFFVLSGFLIGSICVQQRSSTNFLSIFFKKRLLRLLPPYALLICTYLITCMFIDSTELPWLLKSTFSILWFATPLQNVLMAWTDSYHSGALSIVWSLSVEEQFYLIAPFLFRRLALRHVFGIMLAAVVFSPILRFSGAGVSMAWLLLPYRLDGLGIGMLIAILFSQSDLRNHLHQLNAYFTVISIFSLIFLLRLCFYSRGALTFFENTAASLCFASILVTCLQNSGRAILSPLRSRFLSFFATISYSLYLFHQYVSGMVFGTIRGGSPQMRDLSDGVLAAIAFGISVVGCSIIYFFIERPCLNFSKTLSYVSGSEGRDRLDVRP